MAKYKVTASFVPVDGKLVSRGEEVELDEDAAKKLIDKRIPSIVKVVENEAPAEKPEASAKKAPAKRSAKK